jgi:hypothetical protein
VKASMGMCQVGHSVEYRQPLVVGVRAGPSQRVGLKVSMGMCQAGQSVEHRQRLVVGVRTGPSQTVRLQVISECPKLDKDEPPELLRGEAVGSGTFGWVVGGASLLACPGPVGGTVRHK